MGEVLFTSALIVLALIASLVLVLGLAGVAHKATHRTRGYFHYTFYAIILSTAALILFSGRQLTSNTQEISEAAVSSVSSWIQRGSSLLMLLVSCELIFNHLINTRREKSPPLLLPTYAVFWLCTIAMTAVLGAHPYFSHDLVYTLIIGVAAILIGSQESRVAIEAARNAIFIFIVAGLLLVPILPRLVIDTTYNQGLLHGLPRLAGLAPHAVTLGMLVQVELILLWTYPFSNRHLNRAALAITALAFILAQSKTAWIAFALSAIVLLIYRHGRSFRHRFADSTRPTFAIFSVLLAMSFVIAVGVAFLFGNVDQKIANLLASEEGAQLTSLTGRDQIWRIAFDEWYRYPVFGYGLRLFDASYRVMIGMSNATSGHNQFVDTLARSGSVGAAALVAYFLVLLWLSLRFAKSSGGLTIALFLAMAFRAVTEVPFSLAGYGPEFVLHLLLLISLANEARKAAKTPPRDARPNALANQGTRKLGSARP